VKFHRNPVRGLFFLQEKSKDEKDYGVPLDIEVSKEIGGLTSPRIDFIPDFW
jgi:hypothetical protein